MLASDINNPEFVNPQDPDAMIYKEFYWYEPKDKWESDTQTYETGRKVVIKKPKQIYLRIQKPGDSTTTIQRPMRESDKRRFPKEWMQFQINEGMTDQPIIGWKVVEPERASTL